MGKDLLNREMDASDYVIAADGGLKILISAGLTPDLIVGDFDSAPTTDWREIYRDVPVVTFPTEKDSTDTELAIVEALKLPLETICILGGTGSRLDHTLANMMLLQRIERAGKKGIMLDDHNEISIIEVGSHPVVKGPWQFFSLVPISDVLVVTLSGFKYPLEEAHIDQASSVTISNEFLSNTGIVRIHSGRAFLILSRD